MFGTGGGLTNPGGGGPVWTAIQTFMQKIVASAGIELTSGIWSTLGAGASDVCVKVGSSVDDASVHASAKLWSVRTGVGGVEVESLYSLKSGPRIVGHLSGTVFGLAERSGGASTQLGILAAALVPMAFDVSTGAVWTHYNLRGFNVAGTIEAYRLDNSSGMLLQAGTDSTGTPGPATINKPTGKSAIALGAASVVITNSLVTASSLVFITQHARDATCKELIAVPGAGSFTVSGSAVATAAVPFSWEVKAVL